MIRNFVIELTTKCNIRCRHCILSCRPGFGESIDAGLLSESIRAAADLNIPVVTASGGEPFLEPDLLLTFAREASRRGLRWRIVTNASWGKDRRTAEKLIRQISEFAPGGISISVDQFHLEYVPLEIVREASNLVLESDLNIELNLCMVRDRLTWELVKSVSTWGAPIAMAPVVGLGRAQYLKRRILFDDRHHYGCDMLDSPHLRCSGLVTACCGIPLSLFRASASALILGDAGGATVESLLRLHSRPYTRAVRAVGPRRLVRQIERVLGPLIGPASFKDMSFCEVCTWISSRPDIVEGIESILPEELRREGATDGPIDILLENSPFMLVPSAEHVEFSHLNRGQVSNRDTFVAHGLLFFMCANSYDYFLLDQASLEIVKLLSDSRQRDSLFSWLSTESPPSLKQVRVRYLLGRLKAAGATQSV